jgi:hypothetical protein
MTGAAGTSRQQCQRAGCDQDRQATAVTTMVGMGVCVEYTTQCVANAQQHGMHQMLRGRWYLADVPAASGQVQSPIL